MVNETAERVYVERNWWDGPIEGVADFHGLPHRFKAIFDEDADEYSGTFHVWPIAPEDLALEIERFQIFVRWHEHYMKGEVSIESHPQRSDRSGRFWQLSEQLADSSDRIPGDAKVARMKMIRTRDRAQKYAEDGLGYAIVWLSVD